MTKVFQILLWTAQHTMNYNYNILIFKIMAVFINDCVWTLIYTFFYKKKFILIFSKDCFQNMLGFLLFIKEY